MLWLACISGDCHWMSVAVIYLNTYRVPINFQAWEAPTCTAVSKIQLPVENLLKTLIVILKKKKKNPWYFSPSNRHHKPFIYFQSHTPFSSSEQILRHPLFFSKGTFDLFLKKYSDLFPNAYQFLFQSHTSRERNFLPPQEITENV